MTKATPLHQEFSAWMRVRRTVSVSEDYDCRTRFISPLSSLTMSSGNVPNHVTAAARNGPGLITARGERNQRTLARFH